MTQITNPAKNIKARAAINFSSMIVSLSVNTVLTLGLLIPTPGRFVKQGVATLAHSTAWAGRCCYSESLIITPFDEWHSIIKVPSALISIPSLSRNNLTRIALLNLPLGTVK